jgi:hypothetical protein
MRTPHGKQLANGAAALNGLGGQSSTIPLMFQARPQLTAELSMPSVLFPCIQQHRVLHTAACGVLLSRAARTAQGLLAVAPMCIMHWCASQPCRAED